MLIILQLRSWCSEPSYDVSSGCCAEQPSEGDDGRETGEVHEEAGGDALHVQRVGEVADVPARLALYVVDQSSTEPAPHTRLHVMFTSYAAYTAINKPQTKQSNKIDISLFIKCQTHQVNNIHTQKSTRIH